MSENGNGLAIAGLDVGFGAVQVLDDVNLRAEAGFTGLIGPNGAGKTTLFNVITGYVTARAGRVTLDGVELQGRPAHAVARMGVARTFQTPKLIPEMSVLENALLSLDGRANRQIGYLLGLPKAEKAARHQASQALEEFGLGDHLHDPAASLSLGSQKVIEVARAILSKPRLLLLDEPAAGLSRADAEKLVGPLAKLSNSGLIVLIIEHDLELVGTLCPRAVMLNFGRVLASGPPAEVTTRPEVIEAYLGGDLVTRTS